MDSRVRRTATAALAAAVTVAPVAFATTAAAAPLHTASPTAALAQPSAMSTHEPTMLAMAHRYATALRQLHGATFEQAFLAGMIPHHAAAVAMAQLELARGAHPEATTLARQIITSQDREITEMTGWLRQWYGLTPEQAERRTPAVIQMLTAQMDTSMRSMTSRLAAVPAGPGFDRAFLMAMIPHHEMAIIEARTVPGHAFHPQVATLARRIIATQAAEVRQMRDWLRAWYGTTG